MVMFFCSLSAPQGPTLLPLGIEAGLESQGWIGRPADLPAAVSGRVRGGRLDLPLCAGLAGGLFQAREQKILEIVTNREP